MRAALLYATLLFLVVPVAAEEPAAADAFSPNQGATALIVHTIESAKQTIRVAAYSFTSNPIADALIEAHRHGIDVQIVLDDRASHQRASLKDYLANSGIPVRLDDRHAITHDKMMIIDGDTVETGSFNYTKAAEQHNAENVVVIHDISVAHDYVAAWEKLWDESE